MELVAEMGREAVFGEFPYVSLTHNDHGQGTASQPTSQPTFRPSSRFVQAFMIPTAPERALNYHVKLPNIATRVTACIVFNSYF